AFADRAHWLGDADFAKVPRGLVEKMYADKLARRIDLRKASKVKQHGQPPRAAADLFEKHTTHIATADAKGNWVAITATVNTSFGSKVIIPGTGIVMNNQMDDFSIAPGVPNAFGLIGAEANSIEPGKRPLSSMSPTIVLKDDRPVMTLGAAGGPRIISQTLLNIINRIDLGMTVEKSLASPRFHHQWAPNILFVESSLRQNTVTRLKEYGHDVRQTSSVGISQAIEIGEDGTLHGAHDPRVPGKAAGY
ncbi:MAG: gamma-glutamyltransferase, partial [Planctomycetes bacterium]|nr:gamma-glutamyltransferase [Planctomycetota bacterium]